MTDVQIQGILATALTQAEQEVEACVVFVDGRVAASVADCLLAAPKWAFCVAQKFAISRAIGAALRFPDLEIIVAVYIDQKRLPHCRRALSLAHEMGLSNLSVFVCGPEAESVSSETTKSFTYQEASDIYIPEWVPCPVHTQAFHFEQADCEQPQDISQRLKDWSDDSPLITMWDADKSPDPALALMIAAQYGSQGRQVWVSLASDDLRDEDILRVAGAIGRARLPLKCIVQTEDLDALTLPWSHWSRLHSWWVHMPLDGPEAVSWMQSSMDHLWPTLICLPPYWFRDLVPARFGYARCIDHEQGTVDLICSPPLYNETMQARASLKKMDIHARVHLVSGLAPLARLDIPESNLILVIDKEVRAPLADVLLPQFTKHIQDVVLCGPEECAGQSPVASDIAARVRAAVSEAS